MKRLAYIAMLLAPMVAQAAEPLQLADNSPAAGPRFISLARERDGTAHVKTTLPSAHATALRSDRTQMNNGFMLIDRDRIMPVKPQHALLLTAPTKTADDDAPQVVHPTSAPVLADSEMPAARTADPVLSLYGDDGETLASFHDALRSGGILPTARIGRHSWPLPATAEQKLVSPYGMRADPFDGHSEFHGGIDISAPVGTAVLATADGTVMEAETDARYGKFISLLHGDGSETHYGHLSRQDVRVGQTVKRGQTIGAVGQSGRATGPHLDYRVSQNGAKIDPMSVLSQPGPALATRTTPTMRPTMPSMVKVISVR